MGYQAVTLSIEGISRSNLAFCGLRENIKTAFPLDTGGPPVMAPIYRQYSQACRESRPGYYSVEMTCSVVAGQRTTASSGTYT